MAPNWASLLWFGVIVALIPAALWLLKRTPLGGASGSALRTVAMLPLSSAQRLAIVEVGTGAERRWLVLGLSPQGIHTLHTMPPQDEAAGTGSEAAVPFSQLLGRLRRER